MEVLRHTTFNTCDYNKTDKLQNELKSAYLVVTAFFLCANLLTMINKKRRHINDHFITWTT